MSEEKITFYFPEFSKKYNREDLDLHDHPFFSSWEDLTLRAWIIQTYLRLKEMDLNVDITDQWPQEGTIVLLSDSLSLQSLEQNFSKINPDSVIVTIRADELQYRPLLSDIEIVQNGKFANNRNCFFIPHWPQPGIIKRNSLRGHKIENIVFKGGRGSLDSIFYSKEWEYELKLRGLNFIDHTEHSFTNWTDYFEADITFAVRPQLGDKYKRSDKPASKLINSWHAEVPAILGSEFPFLELRKSPLDYLEVQSLDEGLSAIDLLLSDQKLYLAMIQNGRERAREFSSLNITKKWMHFLLETVPDFRRKHHFRTSRKFHGNTRKIYHFLTMDQTMFEHKRRIGSLYRSSIKGVL